MTTKRTWLMLIAFSLSGLATQASATERPANYVALKAGIYSPSEDFDLNNVNLGTTFDGDTKSGFDGEIAYGRYLLPTFGLELGVGYFKGTGSYVAGGTPGDVDFDVIPIILSAKVLVPVGPVDPYGELGIGAYISEFNVANNLNTFDTTTTFGMHAGGGVNVNVTPKVFIGVEARYVWAEPSFGGQTIRLNDTDYELNGFKLNGFTTTLGVGYCF